MFRNNTENIAKKIVSMTLEKKPYKIILQNMEEKSKQDLDIDWGMVGDYVTGQIKGGENMFWVNLNLLDFAMRSYVADGENSIIKRLNCQFQLANNYSDQAGLERKFRLYENLINESKIRCNGKDIFQWYWSRGLNRLISLHLYWGNKKKADILCHELISLCLEVDDETVLSLFSDNYPWFVRENRVLFPKDFLDNFDKNQLNN